MRKASHLILCALSFLVTIHLSTAKSSIDTKKYSSICRGRKTISDNDGRAHAILKLAIEVSTLTNILAPSTPQHKAMCYMIYDDARKPDPRGGGKGKFLDRYALVTLYMNTKGPGWIRSDHWLSKESECLWYGITCSRPMLGLSARVSKLDISFNKLEGILPRELAYLSELEVLDLNGNSLQGVLPPIMLTSLKKLKKLHLHMNDMFGNIPKEIGQLTKLQEFTTFGNFFFGTIPKEIANLKKLEILDLYANNLSGIIPSAIGQIKSLKEIYLNDNEFHGHTPKEVCALKPQNFVSDCLGPRPEVQCDCCTICCQGLPDPKCKNMRVSKQAAKKKTS